MRNTERDRDRLATALLIRGLVLLGLAAIALRWPDPLLVGTMRLMGAMALVLGIVELGMALAARALPSTRWFRIGHALASIGFGALAGVVPLVPLVPLDQALTLTMLWLSLYAAFLFLLAARLWFFRRMRDALILWASVNVIAVILCANTAPATIETLLLVGALYTTAMGAVTIVAGRWMRRGWMAVERVPALL